MADVLVARNREGTSLPYLIRVPLSDGIVLKARETWPCTTKVYCHRAEGWPADAEIVERIPVRYSHRPRHGSPGCVRRRPPHWGADRRECG
ncbi:MAG TPA: hypothetical protein PKM36_09570 [Propionibacteriaceae bacterium]|nr:hypothetical protein [Propionibacteriaceae bacterium]HQE31568.1 hypothetical protein [Propionibacteriaceae bacterium]